MTTTEAADAPGDGGAKPPGWWLGGAALLSILTAVAYLPVFGAQFVNLDDYLHVSQEPHVVEGLTWDGVHWMFTHYLIANWHPLTTMTHMLDVELFGLDAGGHHVMSVVWHLLTGWVLLWGLFRITGSALASLVAFALFMLHPTQVESVAWIAQRKTLVCTFFALLTIGAYVHHVRSGARRAYVLSLLAFSASLMSKAMFVTMPALLVVVDFWPLRRWRLPPTVDDVRSVAGDKLPFAALAIACAIVGVQAQHAGGTVGSLDLGVPGRAMAAVIAYARYLQFVVWPFDLTVLRGHPMWPGSGWPQASAADVVWSFGLVGATFGVALWQAGRRPYLLAGFAWFILSGVPVVGFVQLSDQLVAERYAYVLLLGIWVPVAMLVAETARLPGRLPRLSLGIALPLLALGLAGRTFDQSHHWRNGVTLYSRVLQYRAPSPRLLVRLGGAYKEQLKMGAALQCFADALQLDPNEQEAAELLAASVGSIARLSPAERQRALQAFRAVVDRHITRPASRRSLAVTLEAAGHGQEAARLRGGSGAAAAGDSPRERR